MLRKSKSCKYFIKTNKIFPSFLLVSRIKILWKIHQVKSAESIDRISSRVRWIRRTENSCNALADRQDGPNSGNPINGVHREFLVDKKGISREFENHSRSNEATEATRAFSYSRAGPASIRSALMRFLIVALTPLADARTTERFGPACSIEHGQNAILDF